MHLTLNYSHFHNLKNNFYVHHAEALLSICKINQFPTECIPNNLYSCIVYIKILLSIVTPLLRCLCNAPLPCPYQKSLNCCHKSYFLNVTCRVHIFGLVFIMLSDKQV